MGKHKFRQFAEVEQFKNVIHHVQNGREIDEHRLKGNWKQQHFGNNNSITVEFGCGKGEYTVGLAKNNPTKNHIGFDLKGNRIWRGAKDAIEQNITNVAFVRTAIENTSTILGENEVSEIWITFPDPQPGRKREKKRLTSPDFLNNYKNFINPGGLVHLKTDNYLFYEYSLHVAKELKLPIIAYTNDLYLEKGNEHINNLNELRTIKTYYENKFTAQGFKICYLCFSLI